MRIKEGERYKETELTALLGIAKNGTILFKTGKSHKF